MVTTRPSTRPAPTSLRAELMGPARLHVVTGKGGTGKTTVAAALAFALANAGRKVLLMEVEGRQAIAQLWDVPALPYAEQRLAKTPGGGSLWGLAIDAEQAMIEYLDLFYGLKRSGRGLKRMGAVDFVTTLAPGLRDVLLTGKMKESVNRTDPDGRHTYDTVVLDGPPTGRIGKFLGATREVANLTKFGPINRQSEGVIKLLHSAQTAIHIVTVLEEMPVQETLDAAAELTAAGLPIGMVVVNRARPALITDGLVGDGLVGDGLVGDGTVAGGTVAGGEESLAASLIAGLVQAAIPTAHAAPLAAEMADYALQQRSQAANSLRLDALQVPRVELPDLNPPVELGELNELASYFSRRPA